MLGFLTFLLSLIRTARSKAREKAEINKIRMGQLREKITDAKLSENNKLSRFQKKDKEIRGVNAVLLNFLSLILVFFETFPVFFLLIVGVMVLICLSIVIVVIFSFQTAIQGVIALEEQYDFDSAFEGLESSKVICGDGELLPWTEEDLAVRGLTLTDYEKNMYRLGILARDSLDGYGGKKYLDFGDRYQSILMLVGISSIESSMVFHSDGQNRSIFDIPSDKGINSSGYGYMGLSGSLRVANEFPQTVLDNIALKYTPKDSYSYDAQYTPWAMHLALKHLESKMPTVNNGTKDGKIDRILAEWGISANKDEARDMIIHFLLQAQYHGAYIKDYEAYINFWAGLFHATSDKDELRSWDKWAIEANEGTSYAEYAIRKNIMGTTGKNGMHGKDPTTLQIDSVSTRISLNGVVLDKPLWAFMMDKYGDREGMKLAWETVTYMSSLGHGGVGDQGLNFHYGFNSFLQGKRIELTLAEKMGYTGSVSSGYGCSQPFGEFAETVGEAQALLDGKPFDLILDEYLQNSSGSVVTYLNNLRSNFGNSSYLNDESNYAKKMNYKDERFGVPFYGQGSVYKETYGFHRWHYATNGVNTYNKSGCMLFSHAYAASAMTGRLINPAEMGAIFLVEGYLVNSGLVRNGVENIYHKMGLQAETYSSTLGNWDKIVDVLRKDGVVVVRAKKGEFTSSENHFITLNGVKEEGGKRMFSLYTSFEPDKSMLYYEESFLKSQLHHQAVAIWR